MTRDLRFFPKPTGRLSARVHGGRNALRSLALSASRAARADGIDERAAAALRGKARAYWEAEQILAAIENGHAIPKKGVEA